MSMTPYAAAKVVNAALAENEIDKRIPPQMMYNYTSARIRKNQKPLIECDKDNKITESGLASWLEKYIAKLTKVETETEELVEA